MYKVSRDSNDPVKTIRITLTHAKTSALQPYISGGMLTEKKLPFAHPMESLAEKIKSPG